MALHSIELCAGVGMLGEGVRAGFELLGIEHRTVCYVEREAPAAAQLAALMEAGALDSAPIWSDLLTFDGAAWRGCVDFLVAGFPCQDISIAGRRAGLDGMRSGLFFDILDIADDCDASGLVLENVSAIATATATAVDEAEGTLEERAAARVLGELADRGWDAEWITLSASEVGASHGRARWFCLAWRRVADTRHRARAHESLGIAGGGRPAHHCAGSEAVGQSHRARRPAPGCGLGINAGREPEQGCSHVDDAQRVEQPGQRIHARSRHAGAGAADADGPGTEVADASREHGELRQRQRSGGATWAQGCEQAMAHTAGDGRHEGRPESGGQQGGLDAAKRGSAVAHASEPGLPHAEQRGQPGQPQPLGRRAAAELCGAPLFAPGPIDPRWPAVVANRPDLAPAVEPGVCLLADGMAYLVDESRAHQLRQGGNGVVPLQAAVALVELVRRAAA